MRNLLLHYLMKWTNVCEDDLWDITLAYVQIFSGAWELDEHTGWLRTVLEFKVKYFYLDYS